MESPQRAAILRTEDALIVRVLHRKRRRYEILDLPLVDSRNDRALLSAWDALKDVKAPTQELARQVAAILQCTIADPRVTARALPDLWPAAALGATRRPTAAHPRAYNGTKEQPPKHARGESIDLRPFLLSALGVDRLTEALVDVEPDFCVPMEDWAAPPELRLALGSPWRRWTTAERGRMVTAWHRLEARDDPRLQGALCGLAAKRPGAEVLQFAEALLSVARESRRRIGPSLFRATMRASPPLSSHAGSAVREIESVAAIHGRTIDTRFVDIAVTCTEEEIPWVLIGARLSAEAEPFRSVCVEGVAPEGAANLIAALPGNRGDLWRACARWPEFIDVLKSIERSLPALPDDETGEETDDGRRHLIDLFLRPLDSAHEADMRAFLSPHADGAAALMASTEPAFRKKLGRILTRFFWDAVQPFERTLTFARKVCRSPYSASSAIQLVAVEFASLETSQWQRVLGFDDSSWLELEAAARRENDQDFVDYGLNALRCAESEWLSLSFGTEPRALLRAARSLGMLSIPRRAAVLKRLKQRGAFTSIKDHSAGELVLAAASLDFPSGAHPLPKKLRGWARGEVDLTAGQIERHRAAAAAAWPGALCTRLRDEVIRELGAGVFGDAPDPEELSAQMLHALRIQRGTGDNRRSLRRLIRACSAGDRSGLSSHPRNRRWLARLGEHVSPRGLESWLNPPSLEAHVEGLGPVQVGPEMDPLEALRLGTYVGTCLGVGGIFESAAAAVVLDANKHVIFARRAGGSFIARQIVSISESFGLRFHAVYPESDELDKLFLSYDTALQARLGLPISTDSGDESESLVANEAWDDGTWSHADLLMPEAPD